MRLVNGPADFDGVIVDKRGDVAALWSSFAYESGRELVQQNMGVPASLVQEMLEYARGERHAVLGRGWSSDCCRSRKRASSGSTRTGSIA